MRRIFMHCPLALCLALLFLGALGAGCGKRDFNRGSITGEVKLDGKLLKQGSILFTPFDGSKGTVTGGMIENGRYRLSQADGPTVGWNKVAIRARRKTGKKVPNVFAPDQMIDESVDAIPPRFNSASTLKVEIKPGDNTADFEIESQ